MSASKSPAYKRSAGAGSGGGIAVNAAGFASQLPQSTPSPAASAGSAASSAHHARPLSVAWPDTHPDALTPSLADRRADLLSEFNLQQQQSQGAPQHASASAGHSKHGSQSSSSDAAATHTLQPLRSVMPIGSSSSSALIPSPSALSGGGSHSHSHSHSSSSSPGSSGLQALHSSTSHLLSTFGAPSSTAGGGSGGGELTPAKKKLNQFILDLVKNQIKITDDFSGMCRQKLREKDAQLHALQLQLHDCTIEKDALASEFMQLRTQMTSLRANHDFTVKENQKLAMQASRADGLIAHSASAGAAAAASSATASGELSSLKQSYESQLDHALLRQQSHYDSILLQMKSYLAEQEAQVAALTARVAVAQSERDEAKAALVRAEESMRARVAEAERRVEEAQRERSQARSEADSAIQARDQAKSEAQRAQLQAEKREQSAENGNGGGGCCRAFVCTSFWAVILTILAVLTIASTLDATGIAPILCAKFVMGNATSSAMHAHAQQQLQQAAVTCETCPAPPDCAICPKPTECPAQVECASPKECPAAVECPLCSTPTECAPCAAPVECPEATECPAVVPSSCIDVQSALYRDLVDHGLFPHVMDSAAGGEGEEKEEQQLDSAGQPLSREGAQIALILRALNSTEGALRSSKQELTAAAANVTTLQAQLAHAQLQADGLTAQVLELKDQVKAAAAAAESTAGIKDELAQSGRERDELRAEVANLKAQLALAREETAASQAKLAALDQAKSEEKTDVKDTAEVTEATTTNEVAADASAAALLASAAELSALNATLVSVQSDLSALQSTHNATLTELALLNDIVAAQIEMESDMDDAAASGSLAAEVLKRIESMQSKLTGAAAAAEAGGIEATTPTELHSSAAKLASTVSSLGAEMDQVARENESLRSINAEYEAVLELLQGNITALLNREHECITDLETLRVETEEAESRAEAARLAAAAAAPTATASVDGTELAALREEKASMVAEHVSVLAELERVQSQLEEQAAHIPTEDLVVAAADPAEAEAAAASLSLCSTQLTSCNSTASALEGDMASLEGALDKFQQQYAAAQEELHEAKKTAAAATAAAAKAKMEATLPQTACPVCPVASPVAAAVPKCPRCPACRRAPAAVPSGDAALAVVSLPYDFDESGLIDLDIHDEANDGSSSTVAECTSETDSYFYFEQFHERECSRFIHSTSDRLEHIKGVAELQGIGGAGWKDCPESDAQKECTASSAPATPVAAAASSEELLRLTAENARLKLDLQEATAATKLLSSEDASGTAAKLLDLSSANEALQRDLDEAAVIVAAASNTTRSLGACQGSLREAQRALNATRKEMESMESDMLLMQGGAQLGAAAPGGQGASDLEARLSAAEQDARALRADMVQAISDVSASLASGGSGSSRRAAPAGSIPRSVADWLDFGSQVGAALRSFDLHELSYLSAAQRIVATFIYVIADVILFQLLLPRTRPWIGLMVLVWAGVSVLAAFQSIWIGLVLAAANTVLALLMLCKPSAALFAVGLSVGRGGTKTKSDEAEESLDAPPPRRNGVHAALPPPIMHAATPMPPPAGLPPPMRPALNAAAAAPVPASQQMQPASQMMPPAAAPYVHSPAPPARPLAPAAAAQPELVSPTRAPMPPPSQVTPPVHPLLPSNVMPTQHQPHQSQHIPFLPPESPPESQPPHAQLPQRPSTQHISPGPPAHPQYHPQQPQHDGARRDSTGPSEHASSMLTPIPAFSPAGPADHFSSHAHSAAAGASHPNSAGSQAGLGQVGSSIDFQLQPQQQPQPGHHEYPAELTQDEQAQQQAYYQQQQDAYNQQQQYEYEQQMMAQQQQQGLTDEQQWQQQQQQQQQQEDAMPLADDSVPADQHQHQQQQQQSHEFAVDPSAAPTESAPEAQPSPGLFGTDGGEFAAAMTQPIEADEQQQQQQGQQQGGSAYSSQPTSATVSPAQMPRPLAHPDEANGDFSHPAPSHGGFTAAAGSLPQSQPPHAHYASQPPQPDFAAVPPPSESYAAAPVAAVEAPAAAPMSALERKKAARKNFGGFAAAAAAAAAASSSMPTYSDMPSSFPATSAPSSSVAPPPLSPAGMPPPRPSYGMPPPPASGPRPPMPGAPSAAAAAASSESAMDGTAMPPMRPGYAAAGGFGAAPSASLAGRFPMPPAFPQ